MSGWDSHETRDLVLRLYGKAQWISLTEPSLRSFKDRVLFAEYHFLEASNMLAKYIDEKLAHVESMFLLHADYDAHVDFSKMMLRIRAHATAAIQSLHALADTCAHMLLYGLALDREPKAPTGRGITAKSVLRMMQGKQDLDSLRGLFASLVAGPGFERLDALSNMAKHRGIVRPALREDLTGCRPEKYDLPFEHFEYHGKPFSPMHVREFIQSEHDRMQHLLVDIGMQLNSVLRARLAGQPALP